MEVESVDHARNAGWACVVLSLTVLATRIAVCHWRHRRPFDLSSSLVVLSAVALSVRTATNYVSLLRGTANDALLSGEDAHMRYFDPENARDIKIGSIMSLLSRVLLTATLWCQVALLLLFYGNITSGTRRVAAAIKVAWAAWGLSLVGILLATFLECHPFRLYWEVRPGTGHHCTKAYVQLVMQGVSNVVLDLMLLFIAYPLITLRQRSWGQRLSLYTLFALGTFCIIVTVVRLALVFQQGSSQTTRSLWASVQITVSVFVANAPTIYGTLRTARRKGSQQQQQKQELQQQPYTSPLRSDGSGGTAQPRGLIGRPPEESWLKIDEEDNISLMPVSPGPPRTPPPALLIYDEEYGMVAHNPTPPLPPMSP